MTPYHDDGQARFYLGDCREVMATLEAESFHAIVTDPPYELGFMGKGWDRSGIAYNVDVWREALRVAKPGAHLVAFGGTRTYHRLAVAIEDAGWEIRDTLAWMFGSGFPKSLDVSKAIDKAAGAERAQVGKGKGRTGVAAQPHGGSLHSDDNYQWPGEFSVTAPTTDLARQWEGWGTALKPGYESIVWATKPGNCATIDANLCDLEQSLWSMLSASGVELPSTSNPSVSDAGMFDGVRWSADGSTNMSADSFAAMDTLPSEWAMTTCWNTVRLWRRILAVVSEVMSTYTTEITSSLTTDLKTLSSLVLKLTPANMHQSVMNARGSTPPVEPVVQSFAGVAKKLSAIRTLFVPVTAIAPGHISRQAAVDEGPLSPGYEPIVLARKPLQGTVAQNVTEHGAGAINIDGCRIDGAARPLRDARGTVTPSQFGAMGGSKAIGETTQGRWPANVVLDEEAAAMLDDAVGELPGRGNTSATRHGGNALFGNVKEAINGDAEHWHDREGGGPSRFFYTAKASRSEREQYLDGLEEVRRSDGRAKDIENPRLRTTRRRNHHPTVKPVDLMRWLVRLVTPPGAVVLDPFLGSGSTAIAAKAEGVRVVGIELDREYVEIAIRRAAQMGFVL